MKYDIHISELQDKELNVKKIVVVVDATFGVEGLTIRSCSAEFEPLSSL